MLQNLEYYVVNINAFKRYVVNYKDTTSKVLISKIHGMFKLQWILRISYLGTVSFPLDETHLDSVRGLIELRGFHPSTSTSGARRSDAATSDKDKQICFMLMSRT